MDVALVGLGAVGSEAARQLMSVPENHLTVLQPVSGAERKSSDTLWSRAAFVVGGATNVPPSDVVVLAVPRDLRRYARAALDRGAHVVSACDDPHEVRSLLALDDSARRLGLSVVVCAAQAPGLSCVIALHASRQLDLVEEIHVARTGTGGPACARRYHAALSQSGLERYRSIWRRRPGGSGRELVWFPDPIGAMDCYRANLVDPLLLAPAFPLARRITSRRSATRRDRFTAFLPMMRPPHPEGLQGAVRVELRGRKGNAALTLVHASVGRPAGVAGTVAAAAAEWAAAGRLRPGAGGLATRLDDAGGFLADLTRRGVATWLFEGRQPGELVEGR